MTNFLYGSLLNINGNYSGALYHLKQTLRVEPDAMDGKAMKIFETIACQEKLKINNEPPPAGKFLLFKFY